MVSWIWEGMIAAGKWLFNELAQLIYDGAKLILMWIVEGLPDGWKPDSAGINAMAVYVAAANEWVPLDTMATLWGLWVAFVLVFAIVKFILKLIPFIG